MWVLNLKINIYFENTHNHSVQSNSLRVTVVNCTIYVSTNRPGATRAVSLRWNGWPFDSTV